MAVESSIKKNENVFCNSKQQKGIFVQFTHGRKNYILEKQKLYYFIINKSHDGKIIGKKMPKRLEIRG